MLHVQLTKIIEQFHAKFMRVFRHASWASEPTEKAKTTTQRKSDGSKPVSISAGQTSVIKMF